jgi:hypothetical protein
LVREGATSLGPAELLSIILGTGRGSGEDALMLAHRILDAAGGASGLAASGVDALRAIDGIGTVRAARICAVFELARQGGVDGGAPGAVRSPSGPRAAPAAAEAPPVAIDPLETLADRLRGQIPTSEVAVLAVTEADEERPPVTLALGEGLGDQTRPGAYLAQLLPLGIGPWTIALIRRGAGPTASERVAADRLHQAAGLVGLELHHVLLVNRRRHWALDQEGAR